MAGLQTSRQLKWLRQGGLFRVTFVRELVARTLLVGEFLTQQMFGANQNGPPQSKRRMGTQRARRKGGQLTRMAEHGPVLADQNPVEGRHKRQPQQMGRFRKALADQSAPSGCEEPRSPDTMRIQNNHDL
jgi:hypothetical protein